MNNSVQAYRVWLAFTARLFSLLLFVIPQSPKCLCWNCCIKGNNILHCSQAIHGSCPGHCGGMWEAQYDTHTLQDEEPRATPSSSGKKLLMFHYPNKGKLGMISPLLSLWTKSSQLCQTWLSSETHKNIEQICFSWSTCVLAKKQYPEVLQPSFSSLSSCTNKEVHWVPPVCVCCHKQNTFSLTVLRSRLNMLPWQVTLLLLRPHFWLFFRQ